MAISFSRPDPSSPASVSAANFTMARRGFEADEVREFLRMVAAELARLQEREKFLERELRSAQRQGPSAAVALDEDVVTRLLGEEAARILTTSREAAAQIKARAEEGASRLLREATDEAQRVREEAELEAARRRQDTASDTEAELQMAKQQGREMVNEARAYRERVLGELARRRELARQQIESLVHGRDRLLQAFERARIAAVDVMAELTPLTEPQEFVNLAPTTGPVPLIVPASELPPVRSQPASGRSTNRLPTIEPTVESRRPSSPCVEVAVEVECVEEVDAEPVAAEAPSSVLAVDKVVQLPEQVAGSRRRAGRIDAGRRTGRGRAHRPGGVAVRRRGRGSLRRRRPPPQSAGGRPGRKPSNRRADARSAATDTRARHPTAPRSTADTAADEPAPVERPSRAPVSTTCSPSCGPPARGAVAEPSRGTAPTPRPPRRARQSSAIRPREHEAGTPNRWPPLGPARCHRAPPPRFRPSAARAGRVADADPATSTTPRSPAATPNSPR